MAATNTCIKPFGRPFVLQSLQKPLAKRYRSVSWNQDHEMIFHGNEATARYDCRHRAMLVPKSRGTANDDKWWSEDGA